MFLKQIYTDCLAQASYYIESDEESIIIDPIRDEQIYAGILNERKSKLKYIFETHFHADFVSGHIELSNSMNAEIIFGPNADTSFQSTIARDYQFFKFGKLKIQVIHTPGHTMESSCFLLYDEDDKPKAIFTGDTLFIGEVGRPDLAVNPNLNSRDLAGHLFDSLHNKIMTLPDHIVVYPAHGAGSACGKNISHERYSTIGEQRMNNYALQEMTKIEFIDKVLNGISSPPKYFAHDVNMNKNGYIPMSNVLSNSLNPLTFDEIFELSQQEDVVILDVRSPIEFEKGFIDNSINIGKSGMFAPWVGTIISPNDKIILICNKDEEIEVVSRLGRIGYENVIGFSTEISSWIRSNKNMNSLHSIYANDINQYKNNSVFLDVRKESELFVGSVANSINIPLDTLFDNLNKLNRSDEIIIYCAGGYRSVIAASILMSEGFKNVKNIYGGFRSIAAIN